jgi:hypothetical protein
VHPCKYELDQLVNFQDFLPQMFDVDGEIIRVSFEVNDLLQDIEEVFLGLDEMGEFIDLSQLIKLGGQVT